MTTVTEEYRTSDMALVTFLKVTGFTPQQVVWDQRTCHWIFYVSPELIHKVDEFVSGSALIEPKEYNKVFGQTKREFYDSNPDKH